MEFLIVLLLIGIIIGKIAQKASNRNRFATRYVALSDVDNMDGHDFEYFCADLLRYDGFSSISVTKGSNDQGVDIIAHRNGQKYAIQCKRYNNPLGNKPVQEVNTGRTIYGCSQAIVITNSYFTKGAIHAAKATGVMLWDRNKLDSLIRAKQRGVDPKLHPSIAFTDGKNKSIFALCIGVLAVFSLIGIIAVNGHSSQNNTGIKQTVDNTTEALLELDESETIDGLSITITKMMFARHTGNLKYLDMAESEKINCCVYADVENNGDNPKELTNYDVVLICDGIEYKQMLIEDAEFLFSIKSIAPHESIKGKVIDFQIPKDQQHSDSQIVFTLYSPNGQQTSWQLR